MRQCFLVTYDICEAKRLREVYETMRGFGEHLQYSVFLCVLSPMGLATLKGKLLEIIDAHEDQVMFIDLGPEEGRGKKAIETLGRRWEREEGGAVIV